MFCDELHVLEVEEIALKWRPLRIHQRLFLSFQLVGICCPQAMPFFLHIAYGDLLIRVNEYVGKEGGWLDLCDFFCSKQTHLYLSGIKPVKIDTVIGSFIVLLCYKRMFIFYK